MLVPRFLAAVSSCCPMSIVFAALCTHGLASADQPRSIASAFESTVVKITAMQSDQNVPVEWVFTNHWDIPMVIERFDTACGCLSGDWKGEGGHEPVAPGASGAVRASFTPGIHRGLLRKSLHVRFVGFDSPVELTVDAIVPSHVELSTRELVWKSNEISTRQSIEIQSGTGEPFEITSLPGLPEHQFTLTTESITPGTHYRLHITPADAATGQHFLQVRTDSPDPRDSLIAVFLRIEE